MEILKKRVQNAMSAALAGGDGGSLAGKQLAHSALFSCTKWPLRYSMNFYMPHL